MATVNLGRVGFVNKGTYSDSTAYKVNDVVDYNSGVYACIKAHSGQAPTNTSYWKNWVPYNAVNKTGDETIAGVKTFLSSPIVDGNKVSTGVRKNYLINGNFTTNQREYISGAVTTTANQYIFDRWYIPTSGQNATFTATNGITTVTAPASGIVQKIENISNNGGAMTVSYTGTATLTVTQSTDNVTYTAVTLNGKTFTPTARTYIKITLTGGTVSLVKLEDGSVATGGWHPYDGEFGGEVQACQRYLPVITPSLFTVAGQCTSATIARIFYKFNTKARVEPTGYTNTLGNGANQVINAGGGGVNTTGHSFCAAGVDGASINYTVAVGLVAGDATSPNVQGNILFTGCEL